VWWRGDVGPAGKIVGSIWYASSLDTVTWSAPVALTAVGGGALAWAPTIAERVPGELVVAWSSDEAGDKDVFVAASKDGGASWASSPAKIGSAAFNDDLPFVAARGDGSLAMVFQHYDVAAKKFEDSFTHPSNELVFVSSQDGASFSAPVAVTSDPAGQPVTDVIGTLSPSADPGGFSIVWTSTRAPGAEQGDIFALGASQVPASPANLARLTSAPGRDYSPRLAPAGPPGLYLLVWVSDAGGDLDIYHRFVKL
jgi:hypothetical protein